MSAHSPGPWSWSRLDDYRQLTDADDKAIVSVSTDGTGVMVSEDNARLIAVAPEMLALLRRWSAFFAFGGGADDINRDMKRLLARIDGKPLSPDRPDDGT